MNKLSNDGGPMFAFILGTATVYMAVILLTAVAV